MWAQLWFLINMVFVALLIIFLFAHRALTTARQEQNPERIRRLSSIRLIVGILTVAAFVAMAFSFVMNMKVNG
ncbi:hypothetical protein K0T92_02335 [Paenibacillus oenotherae]|uniref:DUF2909 domain-containing protein n=1 Tax=Paenibacillus oenotherae TaxID=1435645 RepID=A0ABS7D0X0_9BACL|nr:hypothetical protein [Paenibacillus oenotherae]MBW7473582.1 hypothetical protein [Paenibacillus oenotherae]